MSENNLIKRKAWKVCIGCALFYGGIFGVLFNCTGLLFTAITEEFGFTNSQISVYHMIKQLSCASFLGLMSGLFTGKNSRTMLVAGAVFCSLSYGLMSVYGKIWQWYISAVVYGCFYSGALMVPALVLQKWFKKGKGVALSVALSPAGIIGALLNQVLSRVIEAYGWRKGVLMLAALSLIFTLPAALFMIQPEPKDGEKAYGSDESGVELNEENAESASNTRTLILVLCFAALAGGYYYNKMNDYLAATAAAAGLGMVVRGNVGTISMVGNISLKLFCGWLLDRIGIFRSFKLWYIMILLSEVLFLFAGSNAGIIYLASFLFSATYPVQLLAPPAILGLYYSGNEFRKKMNTVTSLNNYVCAGMTFAIGAVMDMVNGTEILFSSWIVLCLISLGAVFALEKISNKAKIPTKP